MLRKPRRCLIRTRMMKLKVFLFFVLSLGGLILILNNDDLIKRTVWNLLILSDPIPDKIAKGTILVAVQPFVRAPQIFNAQSRHKQEDQDFTYARIQYLLPIPGQPDRLAFNNTHGVLYMTDTNGRPPNVYLDLYYQDVDLCIARAQETGLLGFAFHPQYSTKASPGRGKFYTAYTAGSCDQPDHPNSAVIREWKTHDPMAKIFSGTSREIFRVRHPPLWHNIGTIAFNPYADQHSDDYGSLYIGLGEGDDEGNAQNQSTLQGSILRIDTSDDCERMSLSGQAVEITSQGCSPEIWAYGFRHPQHFSWDADKRMFIIDIGDGYIEEVNLGIAGGNYGWPLREGTYGYTDGLVYSGLVADLKDLFTHNFIHPVAQYDHDNEGHAIGSGFVYQGKHIPELRGKYVFSDIPTGKVFYIDTHDLRPGEPTEIKELRLSFDGQERALIDMVDFGPHHTERTPLRADSRLGIDAAGELYLLTKMDGWIRKLVPVHRAEHNGH